MSLVHPLQTKTEIRPYYLRPRAGIMLSLPTPVCKWAGTENPFLFWPLRGQNLAAGWMLIAVWISNSTVSYIIYNCLSFAVLILFMSLHSSASLQLCTFLLPVSSGTLLMIKACSMRPLKSLLLIYSILVPKHPSISPFFYPTQFSSHPFHQGQLTSPSLLSIK